MNRKRFATLMLILLCCMPLVSAQEKSASSDDKKPAKSEAPDPRAKKNGKKLLTALDLMKIAGVSSARISPDGARVVYAVNETKMEKDKEWKNVSQIWVAAITGEKPCKVLREVFERSGGDRAGRAISSSGV